MGGVLCAVEAGRSVSGVEELLAKHNERRAEIDAREESVAMVTKAGRKLTQQGHYASAEVSPPSYAYCTHTHTHTHTVTDSF